MSHSREVWLRIRGLPFARWQDERIFFGLQDARDELTRDTHPALKKLFHDLEMHHHPLARDARQPLYRAQPERWFESLVLEDVTRIDAMLDPRLVYAQVCRCRRSPRNFGPSHGHAIWPAGYHRTQNQRAYSSSLQAADYWRVRHQLQKGESHATGVSRVWHFRDALPIVYLVALALRFHPATDDLLNYL